MISIAIYSRDCMHSNDFALAAHAQNAQTRKEIGIELPPIALKLYVPASIAASSSSCDPNCAIPRPPEARHFESRQRSSFIDMPSYC
jgi:hypothetical protein